MSRSRRKKKTPDWARYCGCWFCDSNARKQKHKQNKEQADGLEQAFADGVMVNMSGSDPDAPGSNPGRRTT